MIDQKLADEFRKQLKRDPSMPFAPEFVRTTNLERRLVDEYGFAAIKLLFEDNNSANYFALSEFPAECPWAHLNVYDCQAAIDQVFAPLANELPELLDALKERCMHLYAERTACAWTLHYFLKITLYDGRPYFHVYSGGQPNLNPVANESLQRYGWEIPADLQRFYAIHDGFGPILASHSISVLADIMDPICKVQNHFPESYRFADLLEFHPDGSGNAQCFHRQHNGSDTVDWDHETWEISPEQNLFVYLDDRLSQLDEE